MKIAIFSDNFYPEISGISDSIVLLGKELADLGHEIHFFAPRYSAKDHAVANIPFAELELGKNIHIHRLWSLPYLGSPTKQARLFIPTGLQSWKYRRENFDIVYTQDPFGLGIEALLMAKILKIPLIGTNHTPITEFTRYAPLHNRFFDWAGLQFFAWYYNRCQFVSAPYQGLLDEMRANGFKKPCRALSNPIDLAGFAPAGSAEEKKKLKDKYGLSEMAVLYTGRLAVEKQIDVIIRAMAEVKKIFPNANLAVTGCGSAEEELKKLAAELGLEKNVKFFGRVDDLAHAELYQASDIFAIMSTAETQSLSLMKAMATRMPSVVADARALPDYVGRDSSRGFVVPVGDADALAEKIIFLLKNPDKQKEMGLSAAAFVKNFSARKIAETWQGIFSQHCVSCRERKADTDLKLSFVIPAYNEEKYLGKCLEAVFREIKKTNYDIEVIVVDNASTDKTSEIAKSFPEAKLVYEPKKGLSQARHSGYLASSGDIIANVDSDSTIPPGWIDKVFAEFSANPNLVALSGPYIYPEMPRLTNVIVHVYYFFGFIGHIINHHFFGIGAMLQGGNFIIRRTALDKIGGYNVAIDFYGEDTDVARRIQKVGLVKFKFTLPMYTSSRRFHEEGIIMTGFRYVINHFWVIIFKKPFTKKYSDFREGKKVK